MAGLCNGSITSWMAGKKLRGEESASCAGAQWEEVYVNIFCVSLSPTGLFITILTP